MTLKIFVLIKQVPSYHSLEIDKSTGTIIRDGVKNIINPDDLFAIELGLNLKERYNGFVTVMTMGPPQAEFALRESLAMGADNAILITDPRFAYSDTLQTTYILKEAFDIIKDFDIIICGCQTSDSSTGQVPFQLSEALDIPLITDFFTIEIENHLLKCHRNFGHESQNIEVKLPVLLRIISHFNNPRFISLPRIKEAFDKEIKVFDFKTFNSPEHIDGNNKSPTKVVGIEKVNLKRKNEIIDGSMNEKIQSLIHLMKEHGINGIHHKQLNKSGYI
jgi:electron transfer flavoprotein beta subunit